MVKLETVRVPRDLQGAARDFWRRLAPGLIDSGQLTKRTAPAFADSCRVLAGYQEVAAQVDALGQDVVYQGSNGYLVIHPLEKVRSERWRQIVNVWKEWGMTPKSIEGLEAVEIQSAESAALDAL